MFIGVFFKRLIIGILSCLIAMIIGCVVFIIVIENQTQRQIAETAERISQMQTQTPVKTTLAKMEMINAVQSVETEDDRLVETEDSGHFHGDETWHAQLHAEEVSDLPTGEMWRDGVWYPENYTQADIQSDLAGQPAVTDEEYKRRSLKYLVNSYIQRHWEKYPDCPEQEVLLADAKDHAKWFTADIDYYNKHSELMDEFDRLVSEYDQFMEKFRDSVLKGKKLSSAEARNVEAEAKSIIAKVNARRERKNALMRVKPIKPKPKHTH